MERSYLDFARWHNHLNNKQYYEKNPSNANEFRTMMVRFDIVSLLALATIATGFHSTPQCNGMARPTKFARHAAVARNAAVVAIADAPESSTEQNVSCTSKKRRRRRRPKAQEAPPPCWRAASRASTSLSRG